MAKAASAATNNDTQQASPGDVQEKASDLTAATQRRPGAPVCPRHERHVNTAVYRTKGSVQYCKCNDCGETWTRPRPADANVSVDVMLSLADMFDTAPQIQHGNQLVIMVPIDDAKRLSKRIRELCSA